MQLINRQEVPKDHIYYRTSSPIYKKYLESSKLKTIPVGEKQFGWLKNVFRVFNVAKFERIDEEPNIEQLKKNGFKHGFIIWIPYTRKEIPDGWKNLWINSYFTTTGFTILNDENYFKKWKDRAKRARKKFLSNENLIIKELNTNDFQKIYSESKISQPFKKSFMKYHKDASNLDDKGEIRNFVCFLGDFPIAGLAVLDYNGNSSAHLVSFITKEGKQYQAGTGLIDYWFKSSLNKGIKYINFDHLRDKFMTGDQQGYTDFKENFMDYKVVFPDSYFKLI
nr:hypothetical protein [Candidatus Gracilibacteria bacterium]